MSLKLVFSNQFSCLQLRYWLLKIYFGGMKLLYNSMVVARMFFYNRGVCFFFFFFFWGGGGGVGGVQSPIQAAIFQVCLGHASLENFETLDYMRLHFVYFEGSPHKRRISVGVEGEGWGAANAPYN